MSKTKWFDRLEHGRKQHMTMAYSDIRRKEMHQNHPSSVRRLTSTNFSKANVGRLAASMVSIIVCVLTLWSLYTLLTGQTQLVYADQGDKFQAVAPSNKILTAASLAPQSMERFGSGDPDLVVTDTVYIDEDRYNVDILLNSSGITVPLETGVTIQAGDEILLINMAGSDIGRYETAVVSATTASVLTLTAPLLHSYDGTTDTIMVQRIPHYNEVIVESGGELTAHAWNGQTGGVVFFRAVTLTVAGQISADYLGYRNNEGPGTPISGRGGGSHGGFGGAGGDIYNDVFQPMMLGSGGRLNQPGGGNGGGIIRLDIQHSINISDGGRVSAGGKNGTGTTIGFGGGGSGGSIWVTANNVIGSGTISTDGGRSFAGLGDNGPGGGGSGGRIAIDISNFYSFTGELIAIGGIGPQQNGGPGTVYLHNPQGEEILQINNNHLKSAGAGLLPGSYQFDTIQLEQTGDLVVISTTSALTLANNTLLEGDGSGHLIGEGTIIAPTNFVVAGAVLEIQGDLVGPQNITVTNGGGLELYANTPWHTGVYTFNNIFIDTNATVNLFSYDGSINDYGVELRLANLTIMGTLSADATGYTAGTGPGTSVPPEGNGGAGHGGSGGDGNFLGGVGGPSYGDLYEPILSGSGGGWSPYGGTGGGVIRLTISDTLIVSGTLSANGGKATGTTTDAGGGGAGGSIWLETNNLGGNGNINANGGEGVSNQAGRKGGGGAGGRIAIYATIDEFAGDIQVNGGFGPIEDGENGTIYLDYVDPLTSTIEITPTSSVADGTSQSDVEVTLKTKQGNSIAGEPVAITILPEAGVYVDGQPASGEMDLGMTDLNGQVSAVLTATVPGTKTIEVCSGFVCLVNDGVVFFEQQVVDPELSAVSVQGTSIAAADGVDSVEVLVTARDQFGNLFPGIATTLHTTPASTITPINASTDQNGQALYEVSRTDPAQVVVSATADSLVVGNVVTVTFMGPDLVIEKTGPESVTAGFPISYSITIANSGLLTATGVLVTDTLPAVLESPTYTTAFPDTYNAVAGTIVWEVGDLPPDTSENFTLQALVTTTAPYDSVITNTLTGTLTNIDLVMSDNEAQQATTILEPMPELVLDPLQPTLPVLRGSSGLLTATVENPGTASLTELVISLPPYIPWLSLNPTTTAELPFGETFTFTLEATPPVTQPYGFYRDLVVADSNEALSEEMYLSVYVHPPLAETITAVVTNTMGDRVQNATIYFLKDGQWVRYTEGNFDGLFPIDYQQTTDSNGEAIFSDMEVGTYTYTVSAPGHAPVTGNFEVTTETTHFISPILQALPGLVFEPDQATLPVAAGQPAYFTLRIWNTGPGHAENFAVQTPSDLPWISSGLPYSITQLLAGEAMSVTLFLSPGEAEPATTYQRYITVTADYVDPALLAATIHVVTSTVGTLEFTVTDGAGSPVENADILVTNANGRLVNGVNGQQTIYDTASGTTDANGQISLPGLPVGEYSYFVEAEKYYVETGIVTVVPDSDDSGQAFIPSVHPSRYLAKGINSLALSNHESGNNQVTVQLTDDPFTYEWTVEEIPGGITDTYAITVEVTYEAVALEPVLFVSPAQFCPGESVGYIVANVGGITMTNIILNPHHGGVAFGPQDPVAIGQLAPGEAYTGTFTTSGNPDEADWGGKFNVTAEYETVAGSFDYDTYSKTRKDCAGEGGGGWTWHHNGGSVTGTFTGNQPHFSGGGGIPAPGSGNEVAKLILSGEATLQRQAFTARLKLDNTSPFPIEGIQVNLEARNAGGLAVVNGFAVTPTLPTPLGTLTNSLTAEWLLVPGELGITDTNGVSFDIRAQIVYTWQGQVFTTTTTPASIVVYPQPYINLEFSHTQPDDEGDFYINVVAHNDGYGVARNLALDLSEVTTLGDLDGNGRSLIFELKEATINGQAEPLEYVFHFGDMEPGDVITGQWFIGVGTDDGTLLDEQVITGFDIACNHLPYQGLELSAILNCGLQNQPYLTDDCPFCGISDANARVGGPINTANGNYTYRQGTPSIPTIGNPLQFVWTYNSLNTGINDKFPVFSSTLGLGWTHNYQLELDLSRQEAPDRVVVMRAPHGTPIHLKVVRDGFEPFPGVHASLQATEVFTDHFVYTVTTGSQATYVFTNTGQLLHQYDARGNILAYSYDENGQLQQVIEPVSGHFLNFAYDESGRLSSVTDPISRTTQFGYNLLGHLITVTDTRGFVWPYEYTQLAGGLHLLSHVQDPDGRTVEQTGFDELGRAITQTFRGQELAIAYHDDGRRLITYGDDTEMIHVYNKQDLLVATANADHQLEKYALDGTQSRVYHEDLNGNPTIYEKTAFGYTTAITDALGHARFIEYDARNNWTQRIDPRGEITLFAYDGQSNLITETNHFGDKKSYTYNAYGQMTGHTDENGVTTLYGFNELGQMAVITNALDQTQHFEYDSIGRLITSTDTTGRVTVNVYDDGNNLIQVTENYLPDAPQNHLNQYNFVTRYGYDGAGNQTVMTDTLGRVSLTLLDAAGRVVTQVVNYDGVTAQNSLCTDFNDPDPEFNLCSLNSYDESGRRVATTDNLGRVQYTVYNHLGRVIGTVDNWQGTITDEADLINCLSLPQDRDYDICTLFGHDAVGNSTVMTDTMGRMTRTFYDELNRMEGIILNWDGSTTLAGCLTLPAQRDTNICTLFAYDEAYNTIIMTDTLGQMSRTFYDEMGRTEATVLNWNPATLATPEDCIVSPDNAQVENICTLYEYNVMGQQTVMTNALGQRSLAVYDAFNRPFIQVAGWDGSPITEEADCQFPPTEADTNLCAVTYYDSSGRPYLTKDPLDNLSQIGFNEAGRVVTTTRFLDGIPVPTTVAYNALGSPLSQTNALSHTTIFQYDSLNRPLVTISPEGTTITQTYDAGGRMIQTVNNLGQVTTMSYDELDRVVTVEDAEGHTTQYEYDTLGNRVAVIDANGVRTSYGYDQMRRLEQVIENDTGGSATNDSNIVTSYHYDALGNQVAVINGRSLTSTHISYDALYRPIATSDALSHTTQIQYNALGLRTVMTDANGAVTSYQYDGLNRPLTITYVADNEVVTYNYNALGQPLAMGDSLGTTQYEYDSLYRLRAVTDTLGHRVGYEYDLLGNRSQLVYPDGRVVTTTYDMDNRLVQVEDWDGGLTAYAYDGIGRLITTTLPNQVIAQNSYNAAHHLTQLRYTGPGETLLADFQYQVDGLGQRQVVTETLLSPAYKEIIEAYVAENGLLVLEAENGLVTPGLNGQTWVSQTSQSGYAGESYLRALPDTGQLYEGDELDDSPQLTYPIYTPETANYTVWIRGMAADAAGDSLHLGLNGQAVANTTRLTGFDNQGWQWQSVTMSNTQPVLSLEAGADSLNLWMREDGLRLDRLLLVTDTNYIPTGSGPTASSLQLITHTVPAQQNSHVIHYTYDNLYRLTQATYSGDITADYTYTYDPVGNMTAYTETVTSTTTVTRTFDATNRLESSGDGSGTSSYSYDGNGNLLEIDGPGASSDLRYGYNQRNLLITHTVYSGTGYVTMAEYGYDGDGTRLQQVDYSSGTPITTTYANDTVGLSQVLLADNGTTQTKMLYGLDLIGQDSGSEVRLLLADGLGSVRVEMTDDTVASAITYEPFGNVLQQTGTSGTVYGFTGEQYDTSSEQLYLRARYYNPALHAFMSKDPWSGNFVNPQSINGWSYVENNPANLADPSGMIPFPEDCRKAPSYPSYGDCVREAYGVYYEHSVPVSDYQAFVDEYLGGESAVPGPDESGCYEGPVPYRASGYTEGFSGSFSILFWLGAISGKEVVYDFATMERMRFRFTKNLEHNRGVITKGKSFDFPFSSSLIAGTATWYYGQVNGFRSWGGVDDGNKHTRLYDDYKGEFETSNIGHSLLVWAKGTSFFRATEDATIFGAAYYSSLGLDLGFPIDLGRGFTSYDKAEPDYYEPYFDGPDERGRKSVDPAIVYADLKTGLPGWDAGDFNISGHLIRRNLGQHPVFKYAEIYNGIHYDSYR